MVRNSIFISYSSLDNKWLAEVKKHLSILELNHQLLIWDDTKIKVGSDWKEEIEQSIKHCRVAILLVSNNFLASEFIVKKELPEILNASRNEGAIIFNIILDTCAFHLTDLAIYQCLNNPKFPLEELKPTDRKKVLVSLTTQLSDIIANQKPIFIEGEKVTLNDDADNFCAILVLADLKRNGAKSITEIQNAISLKRKIIVSELNRLHLQNYLIRFKGLNKMKKPSTLWKVSELGRTIYDEFESIYSNILRSTE